MNDISVRILDDSEVDQAVAALRSLKGISRDAGSMREFLRDPSNLLIVAFRDEMPIGFLLAYRLERCDRAEPMLLIYEIGVAPQFQNQGVGTSLVEQAKRLCEQGRFMKMWVVTSASNEAAMNLYRSTGGRRSADDDVVFAYTL
jgi:ribosomal protein S18 acetylase RimI-like enzyme